MHPFKKPFFEKPKVILSFKKKFLKKTFYQRLVRRVLFSRPNQKLLQRNFKFTILINYLYLWISWFNKLFMYKTFLYFLYFSYKHYKYKFKNFNKLYKVKKYFLTLYNFDDCTKKICCLSTLVLKIQSYFFRPFNIIKQIKKINIVFLLYIYFFKAFFKVYIMFIILWWVTKIYVKRYYLKKLKFSKVNDSFFFKFLPRFTPIERRYFFTLKLSLYFHIYLLL